MHTPGQVITFTAKPEHADEFGGILRRALSHVEAEGATTHWLAMRDETDANRFFVVDLFPTPAGREAHLAGEAAKLVLGAAETMLATPPDLAATTLLAGKNVA